MKIVFRFTLALIVVIINITVTCIIFPIIMLLAFLWYIFDINSWKELYKDWGKEVKSENFYSYNDGLEKYYYKTFWDFVTSNKTVVYDKYKDKPKGYF